MMLSRCRAGSGERCLLPRGHQIGRIELETHAAYIREWPRKQLQVVLDDLYPWTADEFLTSARYDAPP